MYGPVHARLLEPIADCNQFILLDSVSCHTIYRWAMVLFLEILLWVGNAASHVEMEVGKSMYAYCLVRSGDMPPEL